jgi:hypothetical protein
MAIWPDAAWISSQGAGAAAVRVLVALGCKWACVYHDDGRPCDWGWMIPRRFDD